MTDPTTTPLHEADCAPDPIDQFGRWYEPALTDGGLPPEVATATALATADADGRPSVRMVLLKGYDADGFVFYTNYESRKAAELAANPHASLLFWWPALGRQVRVEGTVTPVPAAESDAYFASRLRGSQLGAWASDQSRVISDRATLEQQLGDLEAHYGDEGEIPRPPHWGGYRLTPERLEFWQNRADRLHDRIQYRREGGDWIMERLAP